MADNTIEFVNYLKDIKGLSDTSIYHYLTYHRYFKDMELTQNNINEFVRKKKNNSVCRAYIKSYLEFLNKDKEFELPKIKTGTKSRRLIRNVSKVDINKMREYAYAHTLKHGFIIDLLYYGGLRREEITTIKVNSFDWNKWLENPEKFCILHIKGKGKRERKVLINPYVPKKLLEVYLEKGLITNHMTAQDIIEKLNSMDDPLFKKISGWGVWSVIKKYSTKALERDIRPHEIRHARATELENKGASTRDIQRYLGHESVKTTEIYLHSDASASLNKIMEIS